MIKKLFECDCFDYHRFIINNSKKLSLSCDEAIVLIKILDNYKTEKNISIDDISSSLLISRNSLENTLASLMEKGFYEIFISYDAGLGEESISLDGFFSKAKLVLENKIDISNDDLHLIMQFVASKLNRILTSQEIEIINSLVIEDRYTLSSFETACKKLEEGKKLITIRNIAQAIGKKDEPEVKPAPGYVKDFFSKIK